MLRFGVAKNDRLFCYKCGASILYGEHYVSFFIAVNNGGGKIRRSFIFHVDQCYNTWREESYNRKREYWENSLTEPKKRGRPKKYRDGKEIHRKKALLAYHKAKGNVDRVGELEAELSGVDVTDTQG